METTKTRNDKTTSTKPASVKGSKKAKKQTQAQTNKTASMASRKTTTLETGGMNPESMNTMARNATAMTISNDQRYKMIEIAAYLRAEKRGFSGGQSMEDWLTAESEIDTMLNHDQQNAPLL